MASYRTCPRYYANTHSEFGEDWTEAFKVIELTIPILGNLFNKRALTLD